MQYRRIFRHSKEGASPTTAALQRVHPVGGTSIATPGFQAVRRKQTPTCKSIWKVIDAVGNYQHVRHARSVWEESLLNWGYQVVGNKVVWDGSLQNAFHHVARHANWRDTRFLPRRGNSGFVERLTEHQGEMFCQCVRRFLQDPRMDLVWPQRAERVNIVQELTNVLLREGQVTRGFLIPVPQEERGWLISAPVSRVFKQHASVFSGEVWNGGLFLYASLADYWFTAVPHFTIYQLSITSVTVSIVKMLGECSSVSLAEFSVNLCGRSSIASSRQSRHQFLLSAQDPYKYTSFFNLFSRLNENCNT
ncbi:hypothetical protein CSKR_101712 [Clonorchis sinensis]|uniref:Uncharacterized protein n=1 Tax=Clonorchis sinensis TaxID=79923 RepID=A0A3R7D653_CLOSI|nr:hypothetical protein CSKR_101712 [Clonorchis sinensis]